jgi:hypothetical protein
MFIRVLQNDPNWHTLDCLPVPYAIDRKKLATMGGRRPPSLQRRDHPGRQRSQPFGACGPSTGKDGTMSQDDEGELDPIFSAAQLAVLARIVADEAAFDRLADLFAWVYGRPPDGAAEAFQWGAKNTDANLIALGFENRAGFQNFYDLVLMVEQGPRGKDVLN